MKQSCDEAVIRIETVIRIPRVAGMHQWRLLAVPGRLRNERFE